MFGLSSATIKKIQSVFRNHNAVERVIIYGSRAKGDYSAGSDIDLVMIVVRAIGH